MVLVPLLLQQTINEGSATTIRFERVGMRQLNRDAVFEVSLSLPTTSATLGTDFIFDPFNLTIPLGTTLFQAQNYVVETLRDSIAENVETVEIIVTPMNPLDVVEFTVNTPSLLINIVDDDGNFLLE